MTARLWWAYCVGVEFVVFMLVGLVPVFHVADEGRGWGRTWGWRPTRKRIPNGATRALVSIIWYPLLIIGFMPAIFWAMIFAVGGWFVRVADNKDQYT